MTEQGIRPSIVDPHGFHLADAVAKLKGLAAFSSKHRDAFDRIDAVAEIDGKLMALDMRSESVQIAVIQTSEIDVEELFRTLGGDFH